MSSAFSRLLLGLCGSLLPWASVVCTFSFKGIIRLEIWVVSRLLLVNFEHATEDPEETWSWRRQVTLPPRFFHIDMGSCKLKTLRSKDQVYHSRLLLSPWLSNKSGGGGGGGGGVGGWWKSSFSLPFFLLLPIPPFFPKLWLQQGLPRPRLFIPVFRSSLAPPLVPSSPS